MSVMACHNNDSNVFELYMFCHSRWNALSYNNAIAMTLWTISMQLKHTQSLIVSAHLQYGVFLSPTYNKLSQVPSASCNLAISTVCIFSHEEPTQSSVKVPLCTLTISITCLLLLWRWKTNQWKLCFHAPLTISITCILLFWRLKTVIGNCAFMHPWLFPS